MPIVHLLSPTKDWMMPSERKPSRRVEEPSDTLRLQAFLARAGVASRRASEELILDGRVTVNGRRAEIGVKVQPNRDTVRVNGQAVVLLAPEWIMLHKPRGYVTTRDDPSGRKTVYDLLPPELHHLFHVGRLDRDSAGLLVLTNDGEGANRLLHPRYETTKVYRVDVEGRPSWEALQQLVDGVELEDGLGQALSVEPKGEIEEGIYRLVIVMQEGRNREVRRLLEAIGHPVHRLFRREFGPLEIGRLRLGEWRRLTRAELEALPREETGRPAGRKGKGGGGRKSAPEGRGKAPPARGGAGRPRKGGAPAGERRGPGKGPSRPGSTGGSTTGSGRSGPGQGRRGPGRKGRTA